MGDDARRARDSDGVRRRAEVEPRADASVGFHLERDGRGEVDAGGVARGRVVVGISSLGTLMVSILMGILVSGRGLARRRRRGTPSATRTGTRASARAEAAARRRGSRASESARAASASAAARRVASRATSGVGASATNANMSRNAAGRSRVAGWPRRSASSSAANRSSWIEGRGSSSRSSNASGEGRRVESVARASRASRAPASAPAPSPAPAPAPALDPAAPIANAGDRESERTHRHDARHTTRATRDARDVRGARGARAPDRARERHVKRSARGVARTGAAARAHRRTGPRAQRRRDSRTTRLHWRVARQRSKSFVGKQFDPVLCCKFIYWRIIHHHVHFTSHRRSNPSRHVRHPPRRVFLGNVQRVFGVARKRSTTPSLATRSWLSLASVPRPHQRCTFTLHAYVTSTRAPLPTALPRPCRRCRLSRPRRRRAQLHQRLLLQLFPSPPR